jgi:hypothetical protein
MSESNSEQTPKQPPIPAPDTAKKISPIKMMRRGEDTIDGDNSVVFADFSPKILPADFPEEVVVPKDVSAPEPAPSMDLAPASGQSMSVTSVPQSVTSGDGRPNPNVTSSQTSSSNKKSG